MSLIHQVRPLLELGICKEYCMARKTNGSTTPTRKKKSVAPTAAAPVAEGVQKTVQDRRLEDEIRLRAYEIYLERNGAPGDEHQDWLLAEREIRDRHTHLV
jgi:hypothetical protein